MKKDKPRKKQLTMVSIDKIIIPEWFPSREDLGDIVSLARQLRNKGDVTVPIKVRKLGQNKFELVWGKRRLEAAKLAGLEKISALIEENLSDEELLIQHCLENLQRLDKDPVEEAKLFSYMKSKLQKSYDELARSLGLSPDYIYNRVELLKLSPEVIEHFKKIRSATKNQVGLYHLRLLLSVKDTQLQLRLLDETATQGLSVRELAGRIESLTKNQMSEEPMLNDSRRLRRNILFHDLTSPIIVDGSGNVFPVVVELDNNVYSWEICKNIRITHRDTHVDLPCFINPDGKTITCYPLDKFVGRGVVISLKKGPIEPIHSHDLENSDTSVRRGDIVVLNTGWWRYRDDIRYLEYPFLSEEAAEWMVDKKIKILCIDTPSPDIPLFKRKEIDNRPIHRILLENDILIVENLYNLNVANQRLSIYIIPLYFSELSEIPVKVIATNRYQ